MRGSRPTPRKRHPQDSSRGARRPAPAGKRRPFRLTLEALEDRCVPAAAPVMSLQYNLVNATPAITTAFVNDLYQEVLFRAPSSAELSSTATALNNGSLTGGAAFAGLVNSGEYQNQVAPFLALYDAFLNRPADFALGAWVASARGGLSQARLGTNFAQSSEFKSDNGDVMALSNDAFLTFLYNKLYHRSPDDAGRAAWDQQLANGMSRGDLLFRFLQAPEFAARQPNVASDGVVTSAYLGLWNHYPDANFTGYASGLANGGIKDATTLGTEFIAGAPYLGIGAARDYVIGLFEGLLKRDPDPAGYAAFHNAMVGQGVADADVYAALVNAPEFQAARHSAADTATLTYQAFLGRNPTADELAAAVALLNAGNARGLAQKLLSSNEFTQIAYTQNVKHTVVIYQENWSFDGLYGLFPGANGLNNVTANTPTLKQIDDATGQPITTLPQPLNPAGRSTTPDQAVTTGTPDPRFPPANGQAPLPVAPYNAANYVPPDQTTGDIIHSFYHEQLQIDNGVLEPSNGPNDKFVTWTTNPGLVMSYYDATQLPEGKLALQYTLDDNLFHSAYGGSFLNHQYLVAAAAPQWLQPLPAAASFQSTWNPTTKTLNDSNLSNPTYTTQTPQGQPLDPNHPYYLVNTSFGAQAPHPASVPADQLLAPINDTDPTRPGYEVNIGDELNTAGVSWKWYSGGWNNAVAGHADPLFQYHHQPFAYFANYAPLNPDGTVNTTNLSQAHLQDEVNFTTDISADNQALAASHLPAVTFIKPEGQDNEHPGYASLLTGQQHVVGLVSGLQNSLDWSNSNVVITYDEHGGRWDQVNPPMIDPWGVGLRVPGLEVSPFAKRGYVDHTRFETDSILATVEQPYGLKSMGVHDAKANALWDAYDFSSTDLLKNNPVGNTPPTPPDTGGRDRPYDFEGGNPATSPDVNPTDAFIWNKLDDAGVSFRNYGFRVFGGSVNAATGQFSGGSVAGSTASGPGTEPRLAENTDPNFAGFDLTIPDSVPGLVLPTTGTYTRIGEWLKEFNNYVTSRTLPTVEFVRLPNDHTAGTTVGAPTPRAYVADNDKALGQLVDAVSHSPYWASTAIFVIEDDAQDGPDHVDAHRTIAQVISPYTQTGKVDSTFYSQVSMLRTIELLAGLKPMTQFDAAATPLLNSFTNVANLTPYTAITPTQNTAEKNPVNAPLASAFRPLSQQTVDQNEALENQALWQSIKGPGVPMPAPHTSFHTTPAPDGGDGGDATLNPPDGGAGN